MWLTLMGPNGMAIRDYRKQMKAGAAASALYPESNIAGVQSEFEAPGVAATWFIGQEPQLDFSMPIEAILRLFNVVSWRRPLPQHARLLRSDSVPLVRQRPFAWESGVRQRASWGKTSLRLFRTLRLGNAPSEPRLSGG